MHSRSLFSVIVTLCYKIETVCKEKGSMNITVSPLHWKISLKKFNITAFKRKLIHLHVARNVCLVPVQKKNHTRLFMTSFMTSFPTKPHVTIKCSFLREGGRTRKSNCSASLPSPPSKRNCLIQAKGVHASQRLVKGSSKNWVPKSCAPCF